MLLPPFLKPNDTVAIVAPAGKPDKDLLQAGIEVLTSWGLLVELGRHVYSQSHGYMAGTDAERLEDLQSMINRKDIAAIFCARGGYGCSRIVDQLNFSDWKKHPKWLIGFSDITALHLKLYKEGIASIHGEVPVHFATEPYAAAVAQLKDLLFGKVQAIQSSAHPLQIKGIAEGELIGGNLSLIVDALGTATAPDTTGKILLIEEIDEYFYKVDRMLTQLLRAGKLENLSGLIIGQFSAMKDTKQAFNESVSEMIIQKAGHFAYPIAFDFPVGHEPYNQSWLYGVNAQLEVTENGAILNYKFA
jgi:muramoyltetrapeptide carboxypeptidase